MMSCPEWVSPKHEILVLLAGPVRTSCLKLFWFLNQEASTRCSASCPSGVECKDSDCRCLTKYDKTGGLKQKFVVSILEKSAGPCSI